MKANRLRLVPDKDQQQMLRILGDRVSALWNVVNYRCRQAFLAGNPVPGYGMLCAELKIHEAYRALPSDVAQEVLKKVSEAWKSYFALRRKWTRGELAHKPGLPRYRKHRDGSRPTGYIPIKCGRSYAVEAHLVALPLPADLRTAGRLPVPYRGLRRYPGKLGRAEIVFDAGRGCWYFHYAVDVPDNQPKQWTRTAAVDLGVRVAASLAIDGVGTAFHFLGREVLKDWDYWGRRIAAHMTELAHRPKGQRSSRRLRRLYQKRRARWTHAWEGLAAQLISVLKVHRVGCVYIGYPKEIRRDRRYGAKWNGRIHNFWSFDKAIRILEKHGARAGIVVIRVGERGSSGVCPACDSSRVVRAPRHVLACLDCGLKIHSDQAGSRNILRQQHPGVTFPNTPGSSRDGAEAALKPETRRWTVHRWADASNPLRQERPAA